MKMFILALFLPIALFSGEVNETEFNYLIDRRIAQLEEDIALLKDLPDPDTNTLCWLQGAKFSYIDAKCTFNRCCISNSGCD